MTVPSSSSTMQSSDLTVPLRQCNLRNPVYEKRIFKRTSSTFVLWEGVRDPLMFQLSPRGMYSAVSFLISPPEDAQRSHHGLRKNALTIHYTSNDSVLQDGEMVLMDAGGEYQYVVCSSCRIAYFDASRHGQQRICFRHMYVYQLSFPNHSPH